MFIFTINKHLGLNQVKQPCPAGTARWMFTLKQNTTVLSFHHMSLAYRMTVVPLSLPVAVQCTGASANGGIPWWRVWTGSPCEVTPRCHCYSKHYTLPQSLTHVWDFTVFVNKKWTRREGSVIWCQPATSPGFKIKLKLSLSSSTTINATYCKFKRKSEKKKHLWQRNLT